MSTVATVPVMIVLVLIILLPFIVGFLSIVTPDSGI